MLSINKLHHEINQREERKKNVYEKILKLCYNRIIVTNQKNDNCWCFFTCPTYIYGLPLYNIMSCIVYIMEDLQKRGFKTQYIQPNTIYIDWKVKPKASTVAKSAGRSIEYDQFRDIMELQNNQNILYGQQAKNDNYKTELTQLGDMEYLNNMEEYDRMNDYF
jgi:hypothetical protein